jgi:hypothetical protein
MPPVPEILSAPILTAVRGAERPASRLQEIRR